MQERKRSRSAYALPWAADGIPEPVLQGAYSHWHKCRSRRIERQSYRSRSARSVYHSALTANILYAYLTADIAVGASCASWPTGGPTAGYGRVLVNWTFSVKALFAGQLVRLHRQSAELCGCPYRAG